MERRVSAGRVGAVLLLLLSAMVVMTACARPQIAELYPDVAEYDGREIVELSFLSPEPFSADSLDGLTETHATRCSLLGFLPFCVPGTDWGRDVGRVSMRRIGQDLARMEALYRQHGYFGTRVVPEIEEVPEDDDGGVHVRFTVNRGDGIVMDSVVVEGTEGIADPDSLQAILPLQPGELFDLRKFVASADTVLEAMRVRGHAYAEVLRNYSVDTNQNRATVWLLAVPGPRVVVDSVLVDGLEELSRRDVRRQLTFDTGDLLRLQDLRESQRNLYDLNLVRFASVAVAADTLQRAPEDASTATVRVALTEAPEHVVETRVGYGSVDCLGLRGRWTDRSVFGGGRQLTLTGSVSRLGLASPVSGLENSLCSKGHDPEIATGLDYRLSADFNQPYFRSPRNQLTATAFSERQSEAGLFQRTATGTRVTMSRRLSSREYVTGALDAEYRVIEATPVLFCFAFRACAEEDIERFTRGRWRNGLTTSWVRDRGNVAVDPTSGYVMRSSLVWSTPLLGSDYEFLRANTEGSIYRPVGGGVVLAGFARLGTFLTQSLLGTGEFVPPEERFFAGGASSVRGYDRYTLGPGLYLFENRRDLDPENVVPSDTLAVEFFPTGGTSIAVLSAEARLPSPILSDFLRWAVFVDAGTVGVGPLWEADSRWRITPGAGMRIRTPVGPARVDLGYNPYPPRRAPLYVRRPATNDLVRIADNYLPRSPSFLDRIAIHIAVGQAF